MYILRCKMRAAQKGVPVLRWVLGPEAYRLMFNDYFAVHMFHNTKLNNRCDGMFLTARLRR